MAKGSWIIKNSQHNNILNKKGKITSVICLMIQRVIDIIIKIIQKYCYIYLFILKII